MHMRAKLNLQQTHEAQHGAAKCSQVQATPAAAKKTRSGVSELEQSKVEQHENTQT